MSYEIIMSQTVLMNRDGLLKKKLLRCIIEFQTFKRQLFLISALKKMKQRAANTEEKMTSFLATIDCFDKKGAQSFMTVAIKSSTVWENLITYSTLRGNLRKSEFRNLRIELVGSLNPRLVAYRVKEFHNLQVKDFFECFLLILEQGLVTTLEYYLVKTTKHKTV